jgi:hypothetical protein
MGGLLSFIGIVPIWKITLIIRRTEFDDDIMG